MEIYTIGFTQTTAESFFTRLAEAQVRRLLDVRLNNSSQLAGFAKAKDLPYFLCELVGATYEHEPLLAPSQAMLDEYKKRKGDWSVYALQFFDLLRSRHIETVLSAADFERRTALLCSESTADRSSPKPCGTCGRRRPRTTRSIGVCFANTAACSASDQ